MSVQYHCKNQRRRALVRQGGEPGPPPVNGIDYLEVDRDQRTLVVTFLHDLAGSNRPQGMPPDLAPLTTDNVLISGGTRLQSLGIEAVSSVGNELRVRLSQPGDYSPYTLTLVQSPSRPEPPTGIDPQLAAVDFRFWVDDVSEFDCQPPPPPEDPALPTPVIDYLAKDYGSFRQLMLDRLSVTLPDWPANNPADTGMVVVELLAYAADHLSYYQDAAATEAYLGTCRRRVSMRRHSRLLDYLMHDGCNARAWVVLRLKGVVPETIKPGITLLGPDPQQGRPGVQFLSKTVLPAGAVEPDSEDYLRAMNQGAQVFETLHDLTLHPALDELHFYTWGDEQCGLPRGATRATLRDPDPLSRADPAVDREPLLAVGRVLVFQEVRGLLSGEARDANREHRHAVRLTQVQHSRDPLTGEFLITIEWADADALPFDLPISGVNPQGIPFEYPLSVAYGNVVLADAGRSRNLDANEDIRGNRGWFPHQRPRLAEHPLTRQGQVQTAREQSQPFDPEAPAQAAMQWSLRQVKPAIALWEKQVPSDDQPGGPQWQPQQDLLISDRFARDFVVETEEDGRAFLRFGDGELGQVPDPEVALYARYRTGNGKAGNVGADTLVNIALRPENLAFDDRPKLTALAAVLSPTNPLPAQGGEDPEPLEQVRLDAPQAFREVLRRAVTEADYEALAEQYHGVQRAVASRRWTGSWPTIFIAVDRSDGRPLDNDFRQGLLAYLEEFRLTGHDVAIESPQFVPLDIEIAVQLQPDYFRSTVQTALLDSFSNRVLANEQMGFFHPNRFTFGQPVYLSQVVARAMAVEGVQAATVTRFRRWDGSGQDGLITGVLRFDRLEIAQLDNLPSLPENGRLTLTLEGGL
jgi:hypothetical protein